MASNVQKTFVPNGKDIRYLNRDFSQCREMLINFSKTYYPNTYKDFSAASPGMMYMEQTAAIGDILSYYIDYSFKEGLMLASTERKNLIYHASDLGYKTKPVRASFGLIDVYQLCPSTSDGHGTYYPDTNYMLIIKENAQFSNDRGTYYILNQPIDFNLNTANSPRTDTIYSRNPDGTPEFFLLKKQGHISSGQVVSKTVTVSDPVSNYTIFLDESNVLGVLDVVDSDNNKWYEVDFIAQELIPIAVPNDASYEGSLKDYRDTVPYILSYLKTSRRFTTFVDANNITSMKFGAGVNGEDDEIVTFDSNLIGNGLSNIDKVNIPLDPSNFLKNENYGMAPANTTLTIRYLIGGGLLSNSQTDEIKNINTMEFDNPSEGLLPEQLDLLNTVKTSMRVSNSSPCVGGKDAETDEEIRMNAMANFATQNRTVTQNDYLVRITSMPQKFGTVAKVQVVTDTSLDVGINRMLVGVIDNNNIASVADDSNTNSIRRISYNAANPFAINVYILSYDANKNLVRPNQALITNLITYLKQTKMLTDGINVIDGYIINIGVDFTISVYKGFNKKDVLLNCINTVKSWFDIEKWSFSQSINLSQLQLEIAKIDGVQAVVDIRIYNKTSTQGNYSPVEYDIASATKNGVVYPSVDPSCWEIKYPDSDIRGNCI